MSCIAVGSRARKVTRTRRTDPFSMIDQQSKKYFQLRPCNEKIRGKLMNKLLWSRDVISKYARHPKPTFTDSSQISSSSSSSRPPVMAAPQGNAGESRKAMAALTELRRRLEHDAYK